MADGTTHRIAGISYPPLRLGQAVAGRSSLWAVCRCGREAGIDPRPWISQGLGRHPVPALEDRLRCACGARSVPLEVRGLAEAPLGVTGGIYAFR